MTPEEASENLVKRVRVMAEFIRDRYPEEFARYWAEAWPGKAGAGEVVGFFSQPGLEKKYVIGQKSTVFRIHFGRRST